MIKKSITITEQQDEWIKSQIELGAYGNESEIFRDLIRDRQLQQRETPEQIAYIREKLAEAERSGFTDLSADEILENLHRKFNLK